MTRVLVPAPLERQAYAPYGDVICADDAPGVGEAANHNTAAKYPFLAALVNARAHARANVSVFRSHPVAQFPHHVARLEKHALSTQMFTPMNASRFLVVVARGGEAPDLSSLRAFIVPGNAAITYHPGTWHHGLLALDAVTDFAGLVWEDGTESDCTELEIAEDIRIAAP